MKTVILAALAFAVACVVAGVIMVSRPPTPDNALAAAKAAGELEPARSVDANRLTAPPEEVPPAAAPDTPPAPPRPGAEGALPADPSKAVAHSPSAASSASQGVGTAKAPLQDPLAREALTFVGADPIANEYWYAAINDPNLPANERQDLIEDLNEDGLSDPKHPVPEDLPLILTRLQLLEVIEPFAMDQVNADARDEAYKDLVNLAHLALGGGEPVK